MQNETGAEAEGTDINSLNYPGTGEGMARPVKLQDS